MEDYRTRLLKELKKKCASVNMLSAFIEMTHSYLFDVHCTPNTTTDNQADKCSRFTPLCTGIVCYLMSKTVVKPPSGTCAVN